MGRTPPGGIIDGGGVHEVRARQQILGSERVVHAAEGVAVHDPGQRLLPHKLMQLA